MEVVELQTLSFEDKVKMLSEKDQWYLLGYVDRALVSHKANQLQQQPRKPTKNYLA